MRKLFFAVLCLCAAVYAGTAVDGFGFAGNFDFFSAALGPGVIEDISLLPSQITDDAIVLGYLNPDTVWVIDRDTTIFADIILLNRARLEITGCTFTYRGDIQATGASEVVIDNARVNLIQDYEYQYGFYAVDSSRFTVRNCEIYSSGVPYSYAGAGFSRTEFRDVDFNMAFCTWAVLGACTLEVENCPNAGEFVLVGESTAVYISHSDTILIWLGFPEGASASLVDPRSPDYFVSHFEFPDTNCSRIFYRLQVDSCGGVQIATMTYPGSDVSVYDFDLFAAGQIFLETADTIVGLVNGVGYESFTAPFSDRYFYLSNSSVRTWNFYVYQGSDITFRNCIFGELLADSFSTARMENSICDGTGGHIGASRSAVLQTVMSSFYCNALVQNGGFGIFIYSTFATGRIIASGRATVFAFNSTWYEPPIVEDSSAVMVSELHPPSVVSVDDSVSLRVSAYILTSPDSPVDFVRFSVAYAPFEDTTVWFPISGTLSYPASDTQIIWDTHELAPGWYFVRLWYVYSAYGSIDSIAPTVPVNLLPFVSSVGEDDREEELISVSSNPFNGVCEVYLSPRLKSGDVKAFVVDSQGKIVDELRASGEGCLKWSPGRDVPAGVYFITVCTPSRTVAKKVLFLK